MSKKSMSQHTVAVVGAGPAGIFAADELAKNNIRVLLINRDIQPGGLAEFGIFFDKVKMKHGLQNKFKEILQNPLINYFGNLTIGRQGDLTFARLQSLGLDGILVAVGAQGTKWLGIPGEKLSGVYHAKDIVYHYNKLPPFSENSYPIGKRVAIIGAGNVMTDVANWLVNYLKVDEVAVIVRRDPSGIKFSEKEFRPLLKNLDKAALLAEMERIRPVMCAFGLDVNHASKRVCPARKVGLPTDSNSRLYFKFLSSIKAFVRDKQSKLIGIELENNNLMRREDGTLTIIGSGKTQILEVDTVIFAIGDTVERGFGLPLDGNEFAKNPNPAFPINSISYEAYDPVIGEVIEGVFLAGWAREASNGLVGAARKDGRSGALALMRYLESKERRSTADIESISRALMGAHDTVVSKEQWHHLELIESTQAQL